MKIVETCSCGARFEVSAWADQNAWDAADAWRSRHLHIKAAPSKPPPPPPNTPRPMRPPADWRERIATAVKERHDAQTAGTPKEPAP